MLSRDQKITCSPVSPCVSAVLCSGLAGSDSCSWASDSSLPSPAWPLRGESRREQPAVERRSSQCAHPPHRSRVNVDIIASTAASTSLCDMSLFSEDSEASNSSLDSGVPVTRDLTNPGVSVVFGSQAVAPNSPTPYTDATQVGNK